MQIIINIPTDVYEDFTRQPGLGYVYQSSIRAMSEALLKGTVDARAKMDSLANKLCVFMVRVDHYEFRDDYNDFEDFVKETSKSLWLSDERKGIAKRLKQIFEEYDDDKMAGEAYDLYREVVAI